MFHRRSKEKPEPLVEFDQKGNSPEDVTARTIAQEVLRSLLAAQERQLGGIARELHDNICQRLYMLSLKIEKVAKDWATGQRHIDVELKQIRQQCSNLTADVQALSHELHPSILDNLGLVIALRSFCREVSEQTGAAVNFTYRKIPDALPRDISLALFRVAQEALHNAVKYSGQKHFEVDLQGKFDGIELDVRDEGVGFDVRTAKTMAGLGLVSMRERVHLVNGTINIDSRPNAGTRIHVSVPFDEPSRLLRDAVN